ncbi:hypothetical protein HY031_01535 [Candidatus Gottesmanbacteria bacterium]|nr:hypothetical protein [Candidatus Gottesmanbacteria bacterium]
MHAFLIVGGTKDARVKTIQKKLTEWRVGTFDCISVSPLSGSIGIGDVREFARRMTLTPYQSPLSVGVINEAHALTLQAQQALLKTLEEPPPHARIILEASHAQTLLPTVISRCSVLDLGHATEYSQKDMASCISVILKLARADLKDRLAAVNELTTTRDNAENWVDLAISACREAMLASHETSTPISKTPDFDVTKLLKRLLAAKNQLSVNVNPTLVVDNLILSLN